MESIKVKHLEQLHDYRQQLRRSPRLRRLFLELTLRCNENCLHCGSRCGEAGNRAFWQSGQINADTAKTELSTEDYHAFLDKVKADFAEALPMLCITGGEPLLRQDYFEIMEYAHRLGFTWGMTSNGTLITEEVAKRLKTAGMSTISVSIDGTEAIHNTFRRSKDGFARTVEGVRNLMKQGFEAVQVTTVVTKKSLGCLDELFQLMLDLDVDSWRVIGIEPIGRALELEGYALSDAEQRQMLNYIRAKRQEGYPVTYGCSHFLGLDYEREVRDWYFLCNAGIYTASIMANGDIGACLDIERRPETIQGNIFRDDFKQVWTERFQIFRTSLAEQSEKCSACPERRYCEGGSYHSWDYDRREQRICFCNP